MMEVYAEAKAKSKVAEPIRTSSSGSGIQRRLSSPSLCLQSPSPLNSGFPVPLKAVTPKSRRNWSFSRNNLLTSPRSLHSHENPARGNEVIFTHSDGQKESLERNSNKLRPPHINMSKMYDLNSLGAKQISEQLSRKPFVRLDQQIIKKVPTGSPVIANHKVLRK